MPAAHLDVRKLYRLTVVGTGPAGVAGASDLPLDGSGPGRAGRDYVATISRATLAGPGRTPPRQPIPSFPGPSTTR